MGLPIANGPPPAAANQASADASFEPGPTVANLCGFKLPTFTFKLGFKLPTIKFPPPVPTFKPSLGINCSTTNPISVNAGFAWGGGRVATYDVDTDQQLDAATS
jgi:hypothetical protein